MSNELTFEGVWASLQEIAKRFQESERLMQKSSMETDRKFQESERRFQETERLIKESDMETNRQLQETRQLVDKVSRDIGNLGNRLGEFVEYMVKPAVVRLFQERGIAVHEVHHQVTSDRNNRIMEIDLLVVNDGEVVAVECKSALTLRDAAKHIKRLHLFKEMFPSYAKMKLYGAVAGMVVQKEVSAFAEENGLFLLAQNGNNIEIANRPGFLPTEY